MSFLPEKRKLAGAQERAAGNGSRMQGEQEASPPAALALQEELRGGKNSEKEKEVLSRKDVLVERREREAPIFQLWEKKALMRPAAKKKSIYL